MTVILAAAAILVLGYVLVSAALRRIRAAPLRLPSTPIPDRWRGMVDENVPLARTLSPDEGSACCAWCSCFSPTSTSKDAPVSP